MERAEESDTRNSQDKLGWETIPAVRSRKNMEDDKTNAEGISHKQGRMWGLSVRENVIFHHGKPILSRRSLI